LYNFLALKKKVDFRQLMDLAQKIRAEKRRGFWTLKILSLMKQ